MGHSNYSVASVHQLRGSALLGAREIELRHRHRHQAQDMGYAKDNNQAKRNSGDRKSVRFTPSTNFSDEVSTEADIFTQSPHASRGSVSSVDFADSLPRVRVAREASVQLLKPVVYSPPQDTANLLLPATTYSAPPVSVKKRVEEFEALPEHISTTQLELRLNTEDLSHKRSPSSSSTSSSRRRKDDIYFTPVDVTRSSTSLSSPVDSPTLPHTQDDEDQCPTPRASRSLSRPPSAIYVGDFETPELNKNALKITPAQLDQLLIALAKSRMLQKHVQGDWWDVDDVPDDDSIVSSFSQVSLPTLTSASTLYSQQNDQFVNEHRNTVIRQAILEEEFTQQFPTQPNAKKSKAAPTVAFGGVALCDTKIHGTPVRFVSRDYRHGGSILGVGTCTYLSVPYGTEVDCTLRMEGPSSMTAGTRVVIQCKTQVVDRKTGKQIYALMAEEDVTDDFIKAAIAELAEATGKSPSDVEITREERKLPTESPDIDWVALADELQASAELTDMVDDAISMFTKLDSETASMQTLALMSALDRIKENYEDFLILRPTAFREDGLPSNMRLPWVSQRLYTDWYNSDKNLGHTEAAKDFQTCVVANVTKHYASKQAFNCEAYWGPEKQYLHCVPLMESAEGQCDAWACFVRGEFGIDS